MKSRTNSHKNDTNGNVIRRGRTPIRTAALLALVALAATAAFSYGSFGSSFQNLFSAVGLGGSVALANTQTEVAFDPAEAFVAPAPADTQISVGRSGHTATLLSGSRVLLAGGSGDTSAEVYDASTGVSSSTGNLNEARSNHTATLLSDGRVLIAGGSVGNSASDTTELYDPSNGTFAIGPTMTAARSGHTATLLADGKVLITGGGTDTAEIFDGTSFTKVSGSMNASRTNASAALMKDARVFIASGDGINSAEIFNPADSTFTAVGNQMTIVRSRALLRVLPDSKVQIIGGGGSDVSMEVYDPAIDTIGAYAHVIPGTDTCAGLPAAIFGAPTRAALFFNGPSDPLRTGSADPFFDRTGQTITELPGNQALIVGGKNSSGAAFATASIVKSSPATVTTDKLDYAPGQTATISGTGYRPGETVRVAIHQDPHADIERNFDIVVDANGNFSGTYLVQEYDLKMKFLVSAKGQASGLTAQTSFTDNKNFQITFAGTGGGSVTFSGVSPNPQPSPVTCTGTCIQALNNTAAGTITVTPNPGSTFAGWSGTWDTTDGGTTTCIGTTSPCTFKLGNGSGRDQNLTVTFNGNGNTTTTVASSANPSTYGQTVNLTTTVARAAGTGSPTGTVQFVVDGTNFGSPVALTSATSTTSTASIPVATLTASTHTVTANYIPSGGLNTSSGSLSGGQVVNKATLTVTADNTSRAFGASDPTFTASYSGFVNSETLATSGVSGNPTFSTTATASSPAGTYPINVAAGTLTAANYSFSFVAGTLTIGKADQTITFGTLTDKTYGDADFAVSATASSNLAITFTATGNCTVTGSTVHITAAGNPGCTITAKQAGDANYNAAPDVSQSFQINKATLTASITGNPTKTYDGNTDATLASTNFSLSGLVGTDSFTVTKTAGTYNDANAGSKTVTATLAAADFTAASGTLATNYNLPTTASGAGTINKATPTVTVSFGASPITYDGQSHPATATVTGIGNTPLTDPADGTITISYKNGGTSMAPGALPNYAATFHASATFTPATGSNYNSASSTTEAQLIINKAVLTVTPETKTVSYGAADPAFTFAYAGFITGEDHTVLTGEASCSVPGTSPHAVGTYTISCTAGTAKNYDFDVAATASFTVNKAVLTVTPGPQTVGYGAADPQFTFDYSGFVLNQDSTALMTQASCSVPGTSPHAVGTYTISCVAGTAANYDFNVNATANFAVTKAALKITASSHTVAFGAAAPSITPSYEGFVLGQSASVLSTAPSCSTTYTAGSPVSAVPYPTSCTGATADNYEISYANGTVTVEKANADCSTIAGYHVTYNGNAQTATGSCTGVGGTSDVLTGLDLSATTHTAAGNYPNDAWTFIDETGNYNNANGTVNNQIDKAEATCAVTGFSGPYDGAAHGADGSCTGIGGLSDVLAGLTVDATTYTNVPGGLVHWSFTNANYNDKSGDAQVTITKALTTTTVSCNSGPFSFTGSAIEPCSATVTGPGLNDQLTVTYSDNVNAGNASASASYAESGNYQASSDSKQFAIDRAGSVTTVTCQSASVVYSGAAQTPCSVSVTGAGGLSLTPDPTYANNIVVGTATASYQYDGDPNHSGSSDSKTFEITRLALTITGAVAQNKPYDGTPAATVVFSGAQLNTPVVGDDVSIDSTGYSANFASADAGENIEVTVTGVALTGAAAGNYSVSQPSGLKANITKIKLTIAGATAESKTYDGATAAVVTFPSSPGGLTGVVSNDEVNFDATNYVANFNDKNAGEDKPVSVSGVVLTGSDAGNYDLEQPAGLKANINKFPLAVSIVGNPTRIYDGTTSVVLGPENFSVTAVGSETFAVTKTAGEFNSKDVANATTVTAALVEGDFTPSNETLASNYTFPTSASGDGHITPATPTVTVSFAASPVTYNAASHPATVTVNGVPPEVLTDPADGTINLTYTPGGVPVNVGEYTAFATFTPSIANTNYTNATSNTATLKIEKAVADCSAITGYTGTYNGAAHSATGTCLGVDAGGAATGGTLDLGASFTNVPGGTAHWTFTGGTNYTDQSGDVAVTIGKANATITVNGYTGVYDGAPHGATGSATGVNGEALNGLSLGASFTNVPGGTANWTFTDVAGNYENANGTATIVITKADPTITVNGYSGVYDGAAHGATGSATGVGGGALSGLDLGASFTNVPGGTASWTFTDSTGNYNDKNGSVEIVITKATPVITWSNPADIVYGTALGATQLNAAASFQSSPLAGTFAYTPGAGQVLNAHNGQTLSAVFTPADTVNFNNQNASVLINVLKATPTVTVTGGTYTYDGQPHAATAIATGYDGLPVTVNSMTITYSPGGGSAPVNAGSYAVNAAFVSGDSNYTDASNTGSIVINKANASIHVTPYNVTFDGVSHTATATATGVNNEDLSSLLDLSGTTHTNAGNYTGDAWAFAGNTNYNSANGTVDNNIGKASATVTVTCTAGAPYIYTSTPQTPCTAQATGVAMDPVDVSGSLSYSNNTNAGAATATASWPGDANHDQSSGNGGFTIGKASSTTSLVCPASVVFNGSAQTPCTASYSGVGGITGSLTPAYTNNTGPGTANVSVNYGGDSNHESSNSSTTFEITNVAVSGVTVSSVVINENDTATLTISFTDPDGNGQTHTGTIDWGNGTSVSLNTINAGVTTFTVSRQFLDDDPTNTPSDVKTVKVSITDGPTTSNGQSTVTINNVAPVITSITGAPIAPIQINTPVSLTASFTDVGTLDTHTCGFNWDDTTPSGFVSGTVNQAAKTCTATKAFAAPGVYTVLASVKDDDTGEGTLGLPLQYIVVFDPAGGFVTGGGWINSPVGACKLAGCTESTTGKANFGFVSKYKKGSNVPDGQTEFQFQAGNLNFHSSSYDAGSLVVQGYKAQYKGVGDINGQTGYKFILTAYDGDVNGGGGVDKFRMKILDSNNNVVYDNRMGTSDDIDSAEPTAIAGGSINIQKLK